MTRHIHFKKDLKAIRNKLNHACDLAREIHRLEQRLVTELSEIDLKLIVSVFMSGLVSIHCADFVISA